VNASVSRVPVVLVVDDNEMNREVLGRRLIARGYEVVTAEDGYQALQILLTQRFDLMILDVMMPGLTGFEVLKEVRKTSSVSELPIIMATARDESEDIVEALSLGANDYVTKPLDFAVLLARVKTHLSLKRALEELQEAHDKLRDAQRRIAMLEERSAEALQDIPAWLGAAVASIVDALGTHRIGVFVLDGGQLAPLVETTVAEPSLTILWRAATGRKPEELDDATCVFPIVGMTGELLGGIVIGRSLDVLDETEKRLCASIAHQLAGAIELRRMREALTAERNKRDASRRQLIERGLDLLVICGKCGRCFDHRQLECPEDGEPLDSRWILPYRILDRYRLVRVLGEGGMATVFEANDEKLLRDVAIKVLKPEYFGEEGIRQRFEQEAQALGQIDHPGVLRVYDTGALDDGFIFLVTEMLRGQDLELLVRHYGPARPDQAARLMRQLGSALSAAHRSRVLHRDIKPGNIFLVAAPDGFLAKMLDFGLAKSLRADDTLTKTGLIVGTPAYMSPEQIQGRSLDARSDIYSLAVVAWEVLTGIRLVKSVELFDIFTEIVRGATPKISSSVPFLGETVDKLFEWALSRDPQLRPAAAEDWTEPMASALELCPTSVPGWPWDVSKNSPTRAAGISPITLTDTQIRPRVQ
jgi:CheY-like chemotaxis protein/tRNA A-37 threonylcarbamoyl transferase component Bud32